MIEFANNFIVPLASWLVIFFGHSLLILGIAFLLLNLGKNKVSRNAPVLSFVIIIPVITATIHLFLLQPVSTSYYYEEDLISEQLIHLSSTPREIASQPNLDESSRIYRRTNNYLSKTPFPYVLKHMLLPTLIVMAWLLGISIYSTKYFFNWMMFLHASKFRSPVRNEKLLAQLNELKTNFAIDREITISESTCIDQPFAMGNNEICIPTNMISQLSDDEISGILAHELAHLKKLDPCKLVILKIMSILLFFQPLIKKAACAISYEAELRADQLAIKQTGNPLALAKSLLKFGEAQGHQKQPQVAAGLANEKMHLLDRVRRLFGTQNKTETKWFNPKYLIILIPMTILLANPQIGPGFMTLGDGKTVTIRNYEVHSNSISPDEKELLEFQKLLEPVEPVLEPVEPDPIISNFN